MPKRTRPTGKPTQSREDAKASARDQAQAEHDRQADERQLAGAVSRFDAFLNTTSKDRLPKLGRDGNIQSDCYLTVRKAAGPGFLSAWPILLRMLDAEFEARRCRTDGLNVVRRLDKVIQQTEPSATGKHGRMVRVDERAVGAAEVLRESILLPVWTMPGPVGNALRELSKSDPDAVQVVNLRATRMNGRLMTFREIARRFRRTGAEGKEYTPQRCQQIFARTVRLYPALSRYVAGKLVDDRTNRLPEDQPTDQDWIEGRTNPEPAVDPADIGRGISITRRNSRDRR